MIEQIDTVLIKLTANPRASYTINDGQTTETVTAANMAGLIASQQRLIELVEEIDRDTNGTGDPCYLSPSF